MPTINGSRHVNHFLFFFFNDTPTTEIYPLPLHDALPISPPTVTASRAGIGAAARGSVAGARCSADVAHPPILLRSEEHTSELQSQSNLVCRLLLEKKKQNSQATPLAARSISST